MRIDRERAEGPVIAGFSGGGFKVDDNVYRAVLITPYRVDGWTPPPLADLGEADLSSLIALDPPPEFLLLGTGPALDRPAPALIAAIEAQGVGVEVMDSRAAARAWAVLRGEGRWIAGAFYPL